MVKKTPSKKKPAAKKSSKDTEETKASGDEGESESNQTKKKQTKAATASAKKTPSKKVAAKKQKLTSEGDEKDDANESMSLKSDADEDEDSKQPVPIEQDPKIQRFRKYMRAAGLRIVKNSELEAFKSKKARYDFMKKIFADAGYKGTSLSIKACQKFKLAREHAKEIAELDLGNIIESTGGRRLSRSAIASARPVSRVVRADRDTDDDSGSGDESDEDSEGEAKTKSRNTDVFSRMRDLISSDEDDGDDKKTGKKSKKEVQSPSQTAKKIIESDEE